MSSLAQGNVQDDVQFKGKRLLYLLLLSECVRSWSWRSQVRDLIAWLQERKAGQAERLVYEVGTVTRLEPVGMGDRSAHETKNPGINQFFHVSAARPSDGDLLTCL